MLSHRRHEVIPIERPGVLLVLRETESRLRIGRARGQRARRGEETLRRIVAAGTGVQEHQQHGDEEHARGPVSERARRHMNVIS